MSSGPSTRGESDGDHVVDRDVSKFAHDYSAWSILTTIARDF